LLQKLSNFLQTGNEQLAYITDLTASRLCAAPRCVVRKFPSYDKFGRLRGCDYSRKIRRQVPSISASESRFQQALALNPNYASAHHFYSICLMTAGRQSEALAEITRAEELDPLSLIISSVHGWIYYEGREFDRALYQFTKTLEMDPKYVPALLDLGASYLRNGEYSKAISKFEEAKTADGETGRILADLAQAYALSGQKSEALKTLHRLEHPLKAGFVSTWDLSLVHIALGDKTRAIELLEKAADERVGWVILLGVDPAFDSLRAEPRFEKLKQRLGIPRPSRA